MTSARPTSRIWIPGLVFCILLGAVCAQAVCALVGRSSSKPVALASHIPASLHGWTVAEEPLGPDPASCKFVIDTLNFDEYVSRVYRRRGVEVELYWAHWNPGKMPARAVDVHAPDCCWELSGYRCASSESNVEMSTSNGPMLAGERRTFISPAARTYYVMYWHLVDGAPYRFSASTHHGLLNALRSFAADAIDGSREQIFITLSSSVPMDTLMGDPGFERILGSLGLAKPEKPAPGRS